MSEVPTPSDPGELTPFLRLRASLRHGATDGGGAGVCGALTAALDEGIRALLPDPGEKVAVVALGGYGREEMSLYSDVDLMILHDVEDPAPFASALFRPLWDAGLKLGHSVRTVDEALAGARQRFDTFTTLLTGRFLTGDRSLYEELEGRIARVVRARPLRRYLVEEELARRSASPYMHMAVDVKEGRGGLRTLHAFDWEQRREALIGRFAPDVGDEAAEARETLLSIRNGLHAVAGRSYDVYAFDLRVPVARWLGSTLEDVSGRLVDAMVTVDRMASVRWPELIRSPGGRHRRREPAVVGNRLTAGSLTDILGRGEAGRAELETLWERGALDDILPVWSRIRTLPHLVPFHDHPVAQHLWRTVDEMRRLIEGDGLESEIALDIDLNLLILAAFLHDIGKGSGADHSEMGAAITQTVCTRLGCEPSFTRTLVAAVRHHLLLAATVASRDIEDPAVVEKVAERLGDRTTLQVVYLLTIADSLATGSSMLPTWKRNRLDQLYRAALSKLNGEDEAAGSATPSQGTEAARHLHGMPEDYRRSVDESDLELHLAMARALDGSGGQTSVRREEAWDVLMLVTDARPRMRRRVAECLAGNGLEILEARLATREDGVAFDTFHVRHDRRGIPFEEDEWDRVRKEIGQVLEGSISAADRVRTRADTYPSTGAARDRIAVHAGLEPGGDLSITVICPDAVGRLALILGAVEDLGLEIGLAKVDTRAGEVFDTFLIRSAPDDLDLKALERDLASRLSRSVGEDSRGVGGPVLARVPRDR